MMPNPPNDRDLVNHWRTGDQEAARLLFQRYAERLIALARKRLSEKLAVRADPEDIVQSVFRTFFGRLRAGQFEFKEEDDIVKLLVNITIKKTKRQAEFHGAEKRNIETEEFNEQKAEMLARGPTPEQEVIFLDQLEHLFTKLRAEDRPIVELRMQNFSSEEIAKKLGTYDRKVRRVLERVRALLEQQEHQEPAD